jgi:hypothetical protein
LDSVAAVSVLAWLDDPDVFDCRRQFLGFLLVSRWLLDFFAMLDWGYIRRLIFVY